MPNKTNNPIKLIGNSIDKTDINLLIEWLKTDPVLTKSKLTIEFEQEFAKKINTKYAVFVNSGSSANLAIIFSLVLSGKLKNNKIIVPAISWVTTVSPIIQLGLTPILCDCDKNNLGLDRKHLQQLIDIHNPAAVVLVHVLGIPNYVQEIQDMCIANNTILIEDCCESFGSLYRKKPVGSFGKMSSFSMYYSHQISTIEGGMVCTDDEYFYNLVLSLRGHGWDRDLDKKHQDLLRRYHGISDFKALYTFYFPGFNLRSTDLQAFIGLNQLKKAEDIIQQRHNNFKLYSSKIIQQTFDIIPPIGSIISNMGYPVVSRKIDKIIKELKKQNIETRPLICGSIGRQPFWVKFYGEEKLKNADLVHDYGFYVPNHPGLTEEDINLIIRIINNVE